MFNEREAMKMRLEQMQHIEIQILQELQKERNQILDRIRELDEGIELKLKRVESPIEAPKKRGPNQNKKHTPLTIEAIKVLKDHSAAISGKELTTTVEKNTGMNVGNITQFMNKVMKLDTNVKKPYRGQYIYEKPSHSGVSMDSELVETRA